MTQDDTGQYEQYSFSRRAFLGASTAATVAVAGCVGGDDSDGESGEPADSTESPTQNDEDDDSRVPDLPRVENPPDAVYVPSHQNAMRPLSSIESGDYAVTPMITYPHKFWLLAGDEREVVNPDSGGVHLMITVWDPQTETVLPVDKGAQVEITKDGELVDQRAPWPMISQRMGFHFGDNVELTEDGTYSVELDLNPLADVRKTGGFEGRFEDGATAGFEFEFTQEVRRELVNGVEYFDESRWGERGALDPMGMGGMSDGDGNDETGGDGSGMGGMTMPFSALPPASEYPGADLGTPSSGDATFVVRYLVETRLSGGEEGYLLVSPRTPYNRVPLPDMALSTTGALEGELVQTLDDEVGYHYGMPGTLAPGDELELVIESPPQVARHRGYETAFLEMPPIEVRRPE